MDHNSWDTVFADPTFFAVAVFTIEIKWASKNKSRRHTFSELVKQLDASWPSATEKTMPFIINSTVALLDHVVLFLNNDIAVGCGAFKVRTHDQIEIKRMYILPSYRKKGLPKNY